MIALRLAASLHLAAPRTSALAARPISARQSLSARRVAAPAAAGPAAFRGVAHGGSAGGNWRGGRTGGRLAERAEKLGRRRSVVTAAGGDAGGESSPEEEAAFWSRIQEHQQAVPKLAPAEEARTVVDRCTRGVLSTYSQKFEGFPFGSMVTYASDDQGRPILAISALSPHTADLLADPRCSLLVSRNPLVTSDTVVTLLARATLVDESERAAVREAYLKRHPTAFWVDFGDFHLLRVEPVRVRMTGNVATFAAGASVSELAAQEYAGAQPDPIAPFEAPIAAHMNSDHEDAVRAMVHAALQVEVPSAKILYVDRFGFLVETPLKGQVSRVRLPFPRPATSRKDVKDLIVEMTRQAQGTSGQK
ncbi:unnamed protein product [Closterium sp. Yama58-4]|nr:unnamed protein product [Closterium sp. Yama58-4]